MRLITEYIQKINLLPWEDAANKMTESDEEPPSIAFNPEDMTSLFNVNTFL